MASPRGIRFYRWRNKFAEHPVCAIEIEIRGAAAWRGASLASNQAAVLRERFPDLAPHLAELDPFSLIAQLALSLQRSIDPVPAICGVEEVNPQRTQATVFFACQDQHVGASTSQFAASVANALLAERGLSPEQLAKMLDEIARRIGLAGLDQSTRAMAAEATRRGIPWHRIGASKHLLLGQGHKLRQVNETLRSGESAIAVETSRNKILALEMLGSVCLPVGKIGLALEPEAAVATAEQIGYPVVLKPVTGRKGEGVFVGLQNGAEVRAALAKVANQGRAFMLQRFFPGADHRLLVVAGRLVAAARRIPAAVVGDGRQSVQELVATTNRDARRGTGFSNAMNQIEIDDDTARVLAGQGLTLASIPPAGQEVRIKATANISTGGTAVDVTDEIHPDNAAAAVKAAKTIGLTVAGVDFLSTDISRSWREIGGGICEVNSVVGLRPHWLGKPTRDVVGPIIDTIFPPGEQGRILTAQITGTRGKTTTALMLSSILASAGHVVGTATTDGVLISDELIARGDLAGPTGAGLVLRDPTVTAAVLETARGGLIKQGMYLDQCDVGALLNVGREQIEMDGIETVDDMARLKRKVLEAARRAIVLNADDERTAVMAQDFPAVPAIYFSLQPEAAAIRSRLREGDAAIYVRKADEREEIVLERGGEQTVLLAVGEIPACLNGIVRHNVANALAAAALAVGMGVAREHIAAGLRRYENSLERTRGRFSFVPGLPVQVLFDRAWEAVALKMMLPALEQLPVAGRRLCAITTLGNRPAWHYRDSTAALAGKFAHYVCFERTDWLRNRQPGELSQILSEGLIAAGVSRDCITQVRSSQAAADTLAHLARPDDLIAVLGSDIATSVDEYRRAFAQHWQHRRP